MVGFLTGTLSAAVFFFGYDFTEEFALTFGFLLTGGLASFSAWAVDQVVNR
ncbi:MAG: hypothetical protein ACFB6R_03145 [Alphaproteobacteria bacterium]